MTRLTTALLTLVLALAAAGCGEKSEPSVTSGPSGKGEPFTVMLDYLPNADHAGIYAAQANGDFARAGLDVELITPSDPSAPLRQLQAGRVDLAITYEPELLLARDKGTNLVGVSSLISRPLTSVMAVKGSGVKTIQDLKGKTIGTAGIPYQDAYLDTILKRANLAKDDVKRVNVGFNLVPAMVSKKVDATLGAFWNVEGVELQRRRPGFKVFKVGDYGAPSYPELVLVVRRSQLEDDPGLVKGLIRTLQRGYLEAEADPESAVQAMTSQEEGLDQASLTAQMDAVQPAFSAGSGTYGLLARSRLEAWAAWDVRFGILKRKPDLDRLFDTTLVEPMSRD